MTMRLRGDLCALILLLAVCAAGLYALTHSPWLASRLDHPSNAYSGDALATDSTCPLHESNDQSPSAVGARTSSSASPYAVAGSEAR